MGLRQRVEVLLTQVERPTRYIDSEWNARHDDDASYHVALLYPDTYELGMANQALAILYERLNALDDVAAERCYVPWKDMAALMRAEDVPLFTLESYRPLRECDLVGITLPYELTYTNIVEALELAGIPLYAADRAEDDPLVIGGGPCVYNPEPVAPFFDAILIGEGEEAVADIVQAHRLGRELGLTRHDLLRDLSHVPGVYVPSLYRPTYDPDGVLLGVEAVEGAPMPVVKRVLSDLDVFRAPTCPVVPFMDVVHDRATVEVMRGCTRGCRFCQAGMVYRPVRERSADNVVRDALAALKCTGYEEVSLTSLSTTDHSVLEEILRRLTARLSGSGIGISLPSLRVDSFALAMSRLATGGARRTGLTLAPEAGTQRMRDVINKNVTEEQLLSVVAEAFEAGWRRVKLYFMIGLPTETDEDVRGIGELVGRVVRAARDSVPADQRGSIRVGVSVSTFVPKAQTPFQWEGQVTLDEVRRRQEVLRSGMPRKGVDLSWHDPEVSFLEGVMARGGRELAAVIERAWHLGAVFDAWTEEFDMGLWVQAMGEEGVDGVALASAERDPGSPQPWSHISAGVSERYLRREREKAFEQVTTPDCSFVGCTACDVCGTVGAEIRLAGGTRG